LLRAGIPGLSDNIRVRSVVGRFLEHSRVFHFANDGDPVYAIASADWMTRNLDRRVEALVTVSDRRLQKRLAESLETYLQDNASARVLEADGSYRRLEPTGGEPRRAAQDQLLARIPDRRRSGAEGARRRFTPLSRPRR